MIVHKGIISTLDSLSIAVDNLVVSNTQQLFLANAMAMQMRASSTVNQIQAEKSLQHIADNYFKRLEQRILLDVTERTGMSRFVIAQR